MAGGGVLLLVLQNTGRKFTFSFFVTTVNLRIFIVFSSSAFQTNKQKLSLNLEVEIFNWVFKSVVVWLCQTSVILGKPVLVSRPQTLPYVKLGREWSEGG